MNVPTSPEESTILRLLHPQHGVGLAVLFVLDTRGHADEHDVAEVELVPQGQRAGPRLAQRVPDHAHRIHRRERPDRRSATRPEAVDRSARAGPYPP